jgi:hypothetical protein
VQANAEPRETPRVPARRRLSWAVMLLGFLGACDREGPPRPTPPRRPATPRPSISARASLERALPDVSAPAVARPVPSSLVEFRRRNLGLIPRRYPAGRLAFGRGRIGQLTSEALVVRSLSDFGVVGSQPVAAPRQLLGLTDGSLMAVGRDQVFRLPPGTTRFEEHRRATLFADSTLIADARDAQRFWVAHPGTDQLYLYLLGGAEDLVLPFAQLLPIQDCDHQALASLADGSFVCTTRRGIRHFWAEGKHEELVFTRPESGIWRLVPARRIDQVWAAGNDRKLELYQLSRRAELVRTLDLPDQPLDVAARGQLLALVTVFHVPGQPREWALRVLDDAGHPRFTQPLPASEDLTRDDWVARVLEDRSVVLSMDGSRVAVGGPRLLMVWETATGHRVYPP